MIQNSKNLIIIAILIAVATIGGAIWYVNNGKTTVLNSEQAGQEAIDYINQLLPEGNTAVLMDIVDAGSVYKIHLKIGENEYDSFITKDGQYLFPEGYDLSLQTEETETTNNQEVSKQEKPDVKLFIMSYCPYGLQAQKMFLPVYNLLKEEADMGVYFVNYIMHDKIEIDENLNQYCVQKEENQKYATYLNCFVKEGNSEQCLTEAQIDQNLLQNCISETDQQYNIYSQYQDQSTWLNGIYPRFDVEADLNQIYGVTGSPTVVIYDQVVTVNPRSPENFKEIICQSFVSPPQDCSQTLSETAFSPGFGLETGDSSGGGCGP